MITEAHYERLIKNGIDPDSDIFDKKRFSEEICINKAVREYMEAETKTSQDDKLQEIKHLINENADINLAPSYFTSYTPLHIAMDIKSDDDNSDDENEGQYESDDVKLIKFLLENGATGSMNKQDCWGQTPTYRAVYDLPNALKMFCDFGADFSICSDEGDSPLDAAVTNFATAEIVGWNLEMSKACLQILIDAGAKWRGIYREKALQKIFLNDVKEDKIFRKILMKCEKFSLVLIEEICSFVCSDAVKCMNQCMKKRKRSENMSTKLRKKKKRR